MTSFSDYSVWSFVSVIAVLLLGLLLANLLKKSIRFLRLSLIPTSVLGGLIILIISSIYHLIFGTSLLDTPFFGGNGVAVAETLTYHCLALGFIATVFKPNKGPLPKKRLFEIFDSGVTTVSTYLLQGVLGLGITILISCFIPGFFKASGILLCFGFGQGTGQAMNYGNIYEELGFAGGKSFGLSIAALGFISASIGGVIHLNILRKKGRLIKFDEQNAEVFTSDDIQSADEIPMNGSIDKLTIQLGIIFATYFLTYLFMKGMAALIPSFSSILYGFNFLFGVIFGTLINAIIGKLKKIKIIQKEYINPFLMKRISGFFFDLMIIAGVAAIRLEFVLNYWWILILLAIVGAVSTYLYNKLIADTNFKDYSEEQFLVMYGMLTGTASTGTILLRELDPDFKTPAAENLVYQQLPAIVFGFPMMILATIAPSLPLLTLFISVGYFVLLNLILFRKKIFRKKN